MDLSLGVGLIQSQCVNDKGERSSFVVRLKESSPAAAKQSDVYGANTDVLVITDPQLF